MFGAWDDFRELYDQHQQKLKWNRASYLSLEQQRRRKQGDLPREHYELAVVRHRLTETYEMIPLTKKEQTKLPAPGRGRKRPTHRFTFQFDKTLQKKELCRRKTRSTMV